LTDNRDVGIKVNQNANIIKDNVVTGDGSFEGAGVGDRDWEENVGIYVGREANYEDNEFSGNIVSGYYYGFYAYGVDEFIMDGDEYFNNSYGIYLENCGGDTPKIINTKVHHNCEGMRLESSTAEINNTDFNDNDPEELEFCGGMTQIDPPTLTGLYVDWNSHADLLNGDFIENGDYGIYDMSPTSVWWTLTEDVTCTNNDIYLTGWIVPLGWPSLLATNCTINVIGQELWRGELLDTENGQDGYIEFGFSSGVPVGGEDYGIEATITGDTAYANVLIIKYYNQNPGGSGFGNDFGAFINATLNGVMDPVSWTLKMYYTDAQLADSGLQESSLRIRYYNETSDSWITYDSPDGGVNTSENYVWANLTHFSVFGISGDAIPPPRRGGGGGGGGGGNYYNETEEPEYPAPPPENPAMQFILPPGSGRGGQGSEGGSTSNATEEEPVPPAPPEEPPEEPEEEPGLESVTGAFAGTGWSAVSSLWWLFLLLLAILIAGLYYYNVKKKALK
jgi:hypothetical protein